MALGIGMVKQLILRRANEIAGPSRAVKLQGSRHRDFPPVTDDFSSLPIFRTMGV